MGFNDLNYIDVHVQVSFIYCFCAYTNLSHKYAQLIYIICSFYI